MVIIVCLPLREEGENVSYFLFGGQRPRKKNVSYFLFGADPDQGKNSLHNPRSTPEWSSLLKSNFPDLIAALCIVIVCRNIEVAIFIDC
jgi:hypothetical protein